MESYTLLILACAVMATSAWSIPFYPVSRPALRVTRFAPPPPHQRQPIQVTPESEFDRVKRDHHDDYHHEIDHDHDHGHGHGHRGTAGVTGPVHTFVKTDKNANYKWGVRHHVGKKYSP